MDFRGLTFDDILFRPRYGVAERRSSGHIRLEGSFSKNIPLKLPMVSANMDTVTESPMAIAMAQHGGIGVVHRFLSVEEEVAEVLKVKRAENYVIEEPFTLPPSATVREARELMAKSGVGGLVITDGSHVLLGMVTGRDVRFAPSGEAPVSERMTRREKLIVADKNTTLEKAREILDAHRIEKLPLVDVDGILVGLITMKDILYLETHPFATKDARGRLRVAAAVGASGDFVERTQELLKAGTDAIVLDIAHGHSVMTKNAVEALRKRCGSFELVCGNVATTEAVRFFKDLGVEGVKIGIGPGRACTTRNETNIGVPQVEAIVECAAASDNRVPCIADGGTRRDGHIVTALVLGASSVMAGSLFAGTKETPGAVFPDEKTGASYKVYRGMASRRATIARVLREHDVNPYEVTSPIAAEGTEVRVPYRGSVSDVLLNTAAHLRSAVSYLGAKSLAEARAYVLGNPDEAIVRLSGASREESFVRH